MKMILSVLLLMTLTLVQSQSMAASDGVRVVGSSLPVSGPLSERGASIREGLRAAIREINERGGIGRKRIELEVLDDRGDPGLTAQNIAQLARKNVIAILGCLGEASCMAVTRIAAEAKLPLVGPIGGNSAVCAPGGLAFCLHASYEAEALAIANQLKTNGATEVHVLV